MQHIYISDIVRATGLSRMTIWRSFKDQVPLFTRDARGKRFAVADVIARLRQRRAHQPEHEAALLAIDQQRRINAIEASK